MYKRQTTSSSTTTVYVDDEPPTWPDKTLNIANINETYFEVLWISAIDNINVAGYRFYLDGVLKGEYIRNNDNNSIFLDTLSSGTSYTLEVEAYDDNGNFSTDNPIIVVTTASPTTTTTTTTTSTTTTTTTLPPTDLITNGSFELPDPGTSGNFANSEVPGWTNQLVDLSTETRIEIWKKGERSNDANEGNYHIELNWSAASSIYQDVSVSPGDEIDWSFAHRGRQGVDTISFRLGAPGSEVEIGQYSSGKNQWSIYSGTYTVPDGVTTLRVRFHHISVAGGDGGGNHLDSIEIINNY